MREAWEEVWTQHRLKNREKLEGAKSQPASAQKHEN